MEIAHFETAGVTPQSLGLLLPKWNQVHGIRVVKVSSADQDCGDCDALWTDVPGQTVAVRTADCVPIVLYRSDRAVVAAIHAGWRGSFAQIAQATLSELKRAGHDPADFYAEIGPSIGPCCYEVSTDLLEKFSNAGWPEATHVADRKLDLWKVNSAQLQAGGIPSSQIKVHRICTYCSVQPRYASFRRDATHERQWSWITTKRATD